MKSRFLPYATTPARLTAQLLSDVLVAAWIGVWIVVGLAVHHAVAAIATTVGTQVQDGANGIADNLDSAGESAHRVPLVGDAISTPLRAASEAAVGLAGAVSLHGTAIWRRCCWRSRWRRHPGDRDAVAVPEDQVLPAQVDGDRAGADAGR